MFLDDRTVWPRRDEGPRPAGAPTPRQRAIGRLLLIYALLLMLVPISLGSAVDLARYLWRLIG